MKIWIINHYGEVPPEGNYLRHFRFSKELLKMGHEVEMFSASTVHNSSYNYSNDSRPFKKMIIEGVPVTFIKCRNYRGNGRDRVLNILDYFFGVLRLTKKLSPPDIVFSSSPHPLSWLAAERIARRSGVRHVAETRDLWPETFISLGKMSRSHPVAQLLYKVEEYIYKRADALIFTFPGGTEYLKEKHIPYRESYYINNGVDIQLFDENAARYPCSVSKAEREFRVVYTGAVSAANDLSLLIDAARLLEGEEISFYIYGEGYEREELEKRASDLRVHFMGRIQKDHIPGVLKQADLLVMIGKTLEVDRFGLSLNKMFEYMAAGKPILSNMNTEFDLIEESGAGRTVQGDSAGAIVEGILYFRRLDTEAYRKYCNRARMSAYDYDFRVLSKQFLRALGAKNEA